jgi:carboxyl-terminal processing protease
LFENVTAVLLKRYYDHEFRSSTLPGLIQQYADRAKTAQTLAEQRNVVQDFLSRIPSSHLGLLSMESHKYILNDLFGRPYPQFGFQLIELNGENYAGSILEGGPAQTAGLLPWDRIVSIDGIATAQSPRLDWRTDDAYIPDDRDPPVHYLLARAGEAVRLKIERRKGEFRELSVPATDYSALAAARASARVIVRGGQSIGYLHFWYVHITGVPELLKEKLETDFKDCKALVIDLRGRGGNGAVIGKIVEILKQDRENRQRPIVALIDRAARSAKDVLAYEFKKNGIARLVGEKTAGAVIPATFADVGHDSVLMFPSFKLPKYTDLLESKGVDPDIFIERGKPFDGGADPIFEAGVNEAARLAGLPREPRPATSRRIWRWDQVAGTTRAAIAF